MKTLILSMMAVGLLGSGIGVTYAVAPYPSDAMAGQETNPTIRERLTEDTITGTLMKKDGEYYFIQADRGLEKIHIGTSTRSDLVKPGDVVKAYITDEGHATTLQHLK